MTRGALITYYDFSDLLYSSFYLAGFAKNAQESEHRFVVSRSAPPASDLPARPEWTHVLLFKVTGASEFCFCIDTLDSSRAGANNGNGYYLQLLATVKYYFKVNYNRQAIDDDPRLAPFANKIVPVLPFFPVGDSRLLRYFPRLRPSKRMGWTPASALRRFKHIRDMKTLDWIESQRDTPKDLDVFFVMNYAGQPEHLESNEHRYEVMQELQKQSDLKSVVGFVWPWDMPGKFMDVRVERYSLEDYLEQLGRARVAIYVRGLHDCLSFKFGQFLAMGKPVVGQPIRNNAERIMANRFFDEQFRFESPREIVSGVVDLVEDSKKRDEIGEANARTFDERFSPRAVVSEVLNYLEARGDLG